MTDRYDGSTKLWGARVWSPDGTHRVTLLKSAGPEALLAEFEKIRLKNPTRGVDLVKRIGLDSAWLLFSAETLARAARAEREHGHRR